MLLVEDQTRFAGWARRVLGADHAVLRERLSGGNANVTRAVTIDDRRLVLRHPPAQAVSDRAAAGIRREWDLLSAIAQAAPVPAPVAFCEDAAVIGSPFMLVDWVDGVSITDRLPPAYDDDVATVSRIGEELVDALAAIHRIDWRSALPSGFGRPDGFVERQIVRWIEVRRRDAVRALPMLERLGAWLLERLPAGEPAAILHCDYHLDNTLFAPDSPRLRAVIDWEMATVGPPLADLGLLLMFWDREPGRTIGFRQIQAVSNVGGVVSRTALAERWSAGTGLPLDQIAFYEVFAFWRLAAIVEGAYVLNVRGQVDSDYARGLERDVPALLSEAAEVAGIAELAG